MTRMNDVVLNEAQLERLYKSKKKPPNHLELSKIRTPRGLEVAVGNLVYILNYKYRDEDEKKLDTITAADLMKMTERDFHLRDIAERKDRKEIKDNRPYFVDLITYDPYNKIQVWIYLSDERGNQMWSMGGVDEVSPERIWKVEHVSNYEVIP